MFQVLRLVAGERIPSTTRPHAEAGRAMTNVTYGRETYENHQV
jgi:hypothetical protein